MFDVKGDLSGVSPHGGGNAKVAECVEALKLEGFSYYPQVAVGDALQRGLQLQCGIELSGVMRLDQHCHP